MKKTLTVNLNSIVFNIDDDAYEKLNKYLSDISRHFSSDEEKNEIMADIEGRIAELFNDRLDNTKNVITIQDVNEIIGIMGKPSQFSDNDPQEEEQKELSSETKSDKKKKKKRYYRDPENQIIAGVASGLAAYTSWDVTIIRILLVVLAFLTNGFMVVVYLLVWLVAPKAITAAQRLEMQGEDVTVENIKNEFENAKNYIQSDEFKNNTKSFGQRLGEVLSWLLKAFFIFIGGIFAFVGIVVIFALLIALFAVIFNPLLLPDFLFDWTTLGTGGSILFASGLFLVIACPIFLLLFWAIRSMSGKRNRPKTGYWVTLVLWLAGIFMLISVTARTGMHYKMQGNQAWNIINYDDFRNEVRYFETFNAIDVSGNISLNVVQADTQMVIISTYDNFLPKITTNLRNGTLYVNSNSINKDTPIKIDLTTRYLNGITIRGASKITTENQLKTDNLKILLQGASKADVDVDVDNKFEITMEGASRMDLKGKCETVKIKAYGYSKIDSEELITKHADIEVAGASSAKIYASETLNAGAFGASKISCMGNPKVVTKNTYNGSAITVK